MDCGEAFLYKWPNAQMLMDCAISGAFLKHMKERLDSDGKALFFKICKQMHEYFDNAEYYLNTIKDDESSEQDIKEFIDIVLNEEDETEYTDSKIL